MGCGVYTHGEQIERDAASSSEDRLAAVFRIPAHFLRRPEMLSMQHSAVAYVWGTVCLDSVRRWAMILRMLVSGMSTKSAPSAAAGAPPAAAWDAAASPPADALTPVSRNCSTSPCNTEHSMAGSQNQSSRQSHHSPCNAATSNIPAAGRKNPSLRHLHHEVRITTVKWSPPTLSR